jgi:putative component of membrane protein insertase Oxa1/YidC/SpoIIIJ protein YidD
MKSLAIMAINLYQKYISPYKGFRCAYGVYHQNGTCSTIIKSHIEKHGLIKAYPMIRGQFDACKVAYSALQTITHEEEEASNCWGKTKKHSEDAVDGAQCACDGYDLYSSGACGDGGCGNSCSCDGGIPCDCSF